MANDKIKFSTGIVVDEDGYLHQVGTKITATAAELNAMLGITADVTELNYLDGNIFSGGMTVGSGFSHTGTIVKYSIIKVGGIYITEILIDLTDTHGGASINDIIGKDGGTVNCHVGQITAALNGTILGGKLECYEVPAGGNIDIDLYAATEATGAQDALVTDLTEAILCNSGNLSAGSVIPLTAFPADTKYLYLANGAATDAAYTGGRLLITLYGV